MMLGMRPYLLLLLAACGGCGFSVNAGVDPSLDGRLPFDAPPDSPPDAPPVWTEIETITVPCTAQSVSSTTVLQASVMYRLRASGECIANTFSDSLQDAEYVGYNIGPRYDSYNGVDNGIAIDDQVTMAATKDPIWGTYTTTHIYETSWPGDGTTITATFHEANLTNNSGSLKLTILALQ